MEPADVTVILPVYNVGSYIDETLRSLVEQTARPREIVIVDDCSTDDTRARIESLGIPEVRVLSNEENRGPWFSRNRALDAATSRWIALIDGDDWYAPDRLARLVELGEKHDAAMVIDDMVCWNDDGTKRLRTALEPRGAVPARPSPLDPLDFVRWDLGVMKPIFRRSFLDENEIRFNGSLRSGGDFSMFLTVLLRGGRGVLTHDALYNYRFRPGQITADRSKLFTGTQAANEDALAEARRVGREDVVVALHKRGRRIRHQRTLNQMLLGARGREWRSVVRALLDDPRAIGMLVRKMGNPSLIREKLRLGRL